jgi:hypothetical protein
MFYVNKRRPLQSRGEFTPQRSNETPVRGFSKAYLWKKLVYGEFDGDNTCCSEA